MLNPNEFDIYPFQTWRSLDRTQRTTLLAVTIALLAFGISFYVMLSSVTMSAL